jgi:hypothetical protein
MAVGCPCLHLPPRVHGHRIERERGKILEYWVSNTGKKSLIAQLRGGFTAALESIRKKMPCSTTLKTYPQKKNPEELREN